MYALYPCDRHILTVEFNVEKSSLTLLDIECEVQGYILAASRLLYTA